MPPCPCWDVHPQGGNGGPGGREQHAVDGETDPLKLGGELYTLRRRPDPSVLGSVREEQAEHVA